MKTVRKGGSIVSTLYTSDKFKNAVESTNRRANDSGAFSA